MHWLLLMVSGILLVDGHSYNAYPELSHQISLPESNVMVNGISPSTRAHWMRVANQALSDLISPCPFAAFGTAIVNHTAQTGLGELICIGANNNSATGNPTLHGEIAAIQNCTAILNDPSGRYKLDASQTLHAWADLTLYTNAESCPMCASAIRWAGFREYVFGTSIATMIEKGWGQISIDSYEVFQQSWALGTSTKYLGGVLANETDPLFLWQFQAGHPCPKGCSRNAKGSCAIRQ